MSELITKIRHDNFEDEILKSNVPVLLDCWAAWCQPCLAMNPALESTAEQGAPRLKVTKLNVEAEKALSDELKVRTLPTLIVFRNGAEVARCVGSLSATKLKEWLVGNGVEDFTAREPEPKKKLAWNAFYGDPELRDFLFNRLKALAQSGMVRHLRFATWSGEDGNSTSALVRSSDPHVFERLTGTPYSFGCAMDIAGYVEPDDIEALRVSIHPGSDLSLVAIAFVRDWLLDPRMNWAPDFDGDPLTPLRDRWLDLSGRLLREDVPEETEWTQLREDLKAAKTSDPYRGNVDSVASMLMQLSPPPPLEAWDAWIAAFSLNGKSILSRLAWRHAGWTREDIAQDRLFVQWAQAREAAAPGGKMADEERWALGEEWRRQHQVPGYDEKKKSFADNWKAHNEPLLAPMRGYLQKLLASAPR
jgi:thioredoxin 1